jgi:SAM-dependent methyltransferase
VSLAGCDIHEESIAWLEEFMPEVNAFVNQELPPLPLPDASIDVVWAGSVFTHLDESWSGWIAEMHRILDRGGILVASFLASGMSEAVAHEAWDEDRIGMNTLMRGNPWDRGGPSVLLSPWWIREHWGRAFDVLQIEPEGFGAHGAAVLRKRDVTIRPDELERLSDDPREVAALRHNVEQLHTESLRYRRILADPSSAGLTDDQAQAQLRAARLQIDSLRSELATMRSSRSWRVTRPLRFVSVRVRRIGNRS